MDGDDLNADQGNLREDVDDQALVEDAVEDLGEAAQRGSARRHPLRPEE
jgi:hypothetical protein